MVDPLPPVRVARLTDYLGPWAIAPDYAATITEQLSRCDLTKMSARMTAPAPAVEMVPTKNDKRIAVVRIVGETMKGQSWFGGTSTNQVRRDIRAAVADHSVSGILLAIDSPGGSAFGVSDLAADVKTARKKKPVYAHLDDLCASAAYWVASQADMVFANNTSAWVGNVGTIITVLDTSKAEERVGVQRHTFASGPLKAAFRSSTAMTDEQKAYIQALVDESQTHFDAAVKTGRGLNADQMKEVRSGAIYPATRAKELKLIDGIQPLEKTLAALAAAG